MVSAPKLSKLPTVSYIVVCFSCVGSLVTSARVTLHTHESRARFEKQNNMAAQCEVAFLQFKKTNWRSTEVFFFSKKPNPMTPILYCSNIFLL